MEMLRDDNWVLSVGTFLPLVGVVLMMLVPKAEEQMVKAIAVLTSVATLAVGVFTLLRFDFDQAGTMQFVADTKWIPLIKSSYFIGLDGISLPLYFLSMVITLLV
ncbi:MAG: NADH-quinone oxidoreductase subunit M, partial [Actinobacteria bacterium]|nr:NADH-quinone oxidoreductase subunit M [Actinomycetota bacterium]